MIRMPRTGAAAALSAPLAARPARPTFARFRCAGHTMTQRTARPILVALAIAAAGLTGHVRAAPYRTPPTRRGQDFRSPLSPWPPLLPAFVPARSIACSIVSVVSTPKAIGTPVSPAASMMPAMESP